jgi:hypothetical protein
MNENSISRSRFRLRALVVLAGAAILAGCASAPPAPTASLQAARQAIASAERTEAGRFAPGELSEARSKLAAADNAVAQKNMIAAGRLSEESRAGAELASARAAAVKADAVNAEMIRSTETLMDEMQRRSGDSR